MRNLTSMFLWFLTVGAAASLLAILFTAIADKKEPDGQQYIESVNGQSGPYIKPVDTTWVIIDTNNLDFRSPNIFVIHDTIYLPAKKKKEVHIKSERMDYRPQDEVIDDTIIYLPLIQSIDSLGRKKVEQ